MVQLSTPGEFSADFPDPGEAVEHSASSLSLARPLADGFERESGVIPMHVVTSSLFSRPLARLLYFGLVLAVGCGGDAGDASGDGDAEAGDGGGPPVGSGGEVSATGATSGSGGAASGGAPTGGAPSGGGGDGNAGGTPEATGGDIGGTGGDDSGGTGGVTGSGSGGAPIEVTCTGETHDGHVWLKSQADVDALAGVVEISGNLLIDDDPETPITSLAPLACLTKAGSFEFASSTLPGVWIRDNPDLRSLAGLASLSDVTAELAIANNGALEDLGDFSSLTTLPAKLTAIGNAELVNLSGLGALTAVLGFFRIENNDSLLSLDGLDSLVSLENEVQINDNESLERLDGLFGVGTVPGQCLIFDNPSLPQCQVDQLNDATESSCSGSGNDTVSVCSP